jgi:hypothetical protein
MSRLVPGRNPDLSLSEHLIPSASRASVRNGVHFVFEGFIQVRT